MRITKASLALLIPTMMFTAEAQAAVRVADPTATSGPSYYVNILATLQPGDTLELPAGTYRNRLNLSDLRGAAGARITITGPAAGNPALITTDSDCCNLVQLDNTAFVTIKNLTLDANSEGVDESIDAVNAKGGPTHDIVVENCIIQGVSRFQQTVGISTKSVAWGWVVRGNTIVEAGTGMYFGNSDGSEPFVAGLIEDNLFVDTIGYNIEVKFQNPYSAPLEMPTGIRKTLIRNNVFLKRRAQSSWPADHLSGARPNLLVGGFPNSGSGANDLYEIYGNFFYRNADGESLIQASGRVSIHDNVFVGANGASIFLADHDLPLTYVDLYNNTVFGGAQGVRFANGARQQSRVVGNIVFADTPISGTIGTQMDNIVGVPSDASRYLRNPSTQLGTMDFYPLQGQSRGPPLDLSPFASQTDFDRDFNGTPKGDFRFRGAYSGEGTNPGWQLDATRKVLIVRPMAPSDVKAN